MPALTRSVAIECRSSCGPETRIVIDRGCVLSPVRGSDRQGQTRNECLSAYSFQSLCRGASRRWETGDLLSANVPLSYICGPHDMSEYKNNPSRQEHGWRVMWL